MKRDALATIAHIASQLTNRWLPVPEFYANLPSFSNGITYENYEIEGYECYDLEARYWRALMLSEVDDGFPNLPWLKDYLKADREGAKLTDALLRHLQMAKASGGHYMTICSPIYPPLLRYTQHPPAALTAVGDLQTLLRPMVSVVGSRKASPLAMHESVNLGRELAKVGITVVSGGAFGCDIAAHHGVITSGIRPLPAVIVFASGLGELYPRANKKIFSKVEAGGGLWLSERLWWNPPRKWDFPIRNRIIAGMSGVTAVMQASHKSGAMITARLALDLGADIAVLCHSKGDVRATGGEELISAGAFSFKSASEFLRLLI